MKVFNVVFTFLAIAAVSLIIGCQSMEGLSPAENQLTMEQKAIEKLIKELDGISDDLGDLDRQLWGQDLSNTSAMKLNEALMNLRKGIWNARNTVIGGDIAEGESQIAALRKQIKALGK